MKREARLLKEALMRKIEFTLHLDMIGPDIFEEVITRFNLLADIPCRR